MTVLGPDVSSFQSPPNFNTVKGAGFPFAFAKASEGLTWKDPTFGTNWANMKHAGLVRGAYHFGHADPGRSAALEAAQFIGHVRTHGGWTKDDIPVLDIEAGALSGAALSAWVDTWCKAVEQAWGRAGLIYSGKWYLGDRGASAAGPKSRGWKLWTAAYGSTPYVYSGFNAWLFWQFTDGKLGPQPHTVPGVGSCDISKFNGTADELKKFAHPSPTHTPSPAYIKYLEGRLAFRRKQRADVEAAITKLVKALQARGVSNP